MSRDHSSSRRLQRLLFLGLFAAFFLSSCAVSKVGPKTMERTYGKYNETVSDVLGEELLLNVVRRRYFETPQFAAFGAISSSRSLSQGVDVGTGIDQDSVVSGVTGALSGVAVDTGTVITTPQQGAQIASKLHQQIPLSAFSALANAGYPVHLIFGVAAKEIGEVRGATLGAGEIRGGSPQFVSLLNSIAALEASGDLVVTDVVWEEPYFEHAFAPEVFTPAQIISAAELQAESTLESGYRSLDGGETYFITSRSRQPALSISSKGRNKSEGREFFSLLGVNLDHGKKHWRLKNVELIRGSSEMDDKGSEGTGYIPMSSRSFYEVLNLLSQGVQVPESDKDTVAASTAAYEAAIQKGVAPDITTQFVVNYSPTKPKSSFVAVPSRGGWFYIDERDQASKRMFNALSDLYNLQVAPTSTGTAAPFVTLPVR